MSFKVVKYATTGSFTGAERKGNWLFGESDSVDYGPTSTTGFWAGYPKPENGYVLYLNKQSFGPSIYSFDSGTDLLNFCNTYLGAGQTSVEGVLSWIEGQNEYLLDGSSSSLPIPTAGLNVFVDARYPSSYPGSGFIWYDLSGNQNNASIAASNFMTYNSVGKYFEIIMGTDMLFDYDSTADFTIIICCQLSDGFYDAIINSFDDLYVFIAGASQYSMDVSMYLYDNYAPSSYSYFYDSVDMVSSFANLVIRSNNSSPSSQKASVFVNTTSMSNSFFDSYTDRVTNLGATSGYLNFNEGSKLKSIIYYNREITNTELSQIVNYNLNN